MSKNREEMNRFIYRAWSRDHWGNVHTGEALLLACLMHTKGNRARGNSKDLEDVQRIMHDHNLKR